MRRRPAASLAAVAAAVAAVAGAVGISAAGDGPGVVRAERPARATLPDEPPVPSTPCRVGGPGGPLFLTGDQAREVTTAAAAVHRRRSAQDRLAGVVAVTLDQPPAAARHVAGTLLGMGSAERLSCHVLRDVVTPEEPGRNGLVPRAQVLRRAWTRRFGPLPAGGFAAGGVSSGHVDSSSHYDGRAVDVFFRPLGDRAQARRGWVFAQWLAAHADDYDVLSVIYADRIWTSWASGAGWRPYVHPSGNRRNPVLRHLDHVHVAVESGRRYRGR